MRLISFYILLLVMLTVVDSKAQYSFQQLDNRNGLSNSCINSIYQDTDNLIWFGTWDGLNYYDGTNVHVFNYEKFADKRKAIASNVIYNITGDKDGYIWIATIQGVSKFDKKNESFTNYLYNNNHVSASGYTVVTDRKGTVYAAHYDKAELYRFNKLSGVFNRIIINGFNNFLIKKIQFDKYNNLWVLRDGDILECYTQTATGLKKNQNIAPIKGVDNVLSCNGQIFYSTKTKDLFRVTGTSQLIHILNLPHQIRAISYYLGRYYMAWSSHGLGEYDGSFSPVTNSAVQYPVLKNARVTTLMANNNLLWAGTDGNGVIKATPKQNMFGLVNDQTNGQSFHIPVRSFCQVGNELWVGTKGNGIVAITNLGKKNTSFGNIRSFHTDKDQLDNCVYTIRPGADGLIYIGSDAMGITLYDPQIKKMIKWTDLKNYKQFASFGSVHCVLSEKDSSVWLGLNESGLAHLKLTKDKENQLSIAYLQLYKYTGSNNGPSSNVIYSLAHSSNNNELWVGGRYGGLSLFNKTYKKFRTLKAFSYKGSLSNNDVLSLHIDAKARLWVGTSFGLNWINELKALKQAQPQFNKLNVEDGLPNNTIHAISEDNVGRIWISTNKGLACIDPATLKIIQFKESDGLQSDEFSDNAVWKDPLGRLYFGGIYGFNYFLPQNVHLNSRLANLLITQLRFAGKYTNNNNLQVLKANGTSKLGNYEFGPQSDYFELGVQPIVYTHNRTFQYAYYLENNDKDWHYAINDQKIIYNNLPPGNYVLKVKWSNGEGVWTNSMSVFHLKIRQYFWLTPLAWFIYVLTGSVLAYLFLKYRKNKFLMQQRLKMEQMMREKEDSLHKQQLNFFTNIAHELQTPLTLILGSLNRYLYKNQIEGNQSGNYFISVVKQEASRLHYLVLQLLEFRKAGSGFSTNYYTYLDVSKLFVNIGKLFIPLAEPKQLNFSLRVTPGIHLPVDKDKLEKIMYNLLSNAIKYTGNNQSVILAVNKLNDDGQLELIVANSGCSYTNDEVQKVFDQFFVIDPSRQNKNSSGIGLAFTRELVSMLNGTITVACADGWITFRVLLPSSARHQNIAPATETEMVNEVPSPILHDITYGQPPLKYLSVDENNKKAMIKSFEQEDKKMILIVEDEQQIRFLLKDILSEHYIIYEAASGKEALEVIHRITPDLIISDIMMPDLNGLQLCNIIKSTPNTCHIPFVILSARGTLEQQTEGYENGADAYLPKPFQTEHLLVRINKLLEYRDKLHRYFIEGKNLNVALNETDIKKSDKYFIEKVVKVIEDNLTAELDGAFL